MELLDFPHLLKLNDYTNLPVFTKSVNLPPHHIVSSDKISTSLISDGCLIYGQIIHSVLSSGILVEKGTTIKNSVIFSDVKIAEDCYIENAIIIKGTIVKLNTNLAFKNVTVVDNDFIKEMGEDHE